MVMPTPEDRARTLGKNAADAFRDEFGVTPSEAGTEGVGDWDSSAWSMARKDFSLDTHDERYEACLEAWRQGFWGETR